MKTDIIIIGSGLVGLAMAASMQKLGVNVAVLDAKDISISSALNTDLRVYAINHASQQLLNDLGVWSDIEKTAVSSYRSMYVWDEKSNGVLSFNAQELAKKELGHIIEESVIRNSLLKLLQSSSYVSLHPKCQINSVNIDDEQVFLSTNEGEFKAKLIIGADGANSWLRSTLDFECKQQSYSHNALICNVSTEKNHEKTAYQIFTEDGPLAFLPLSKANQSSIVWSVPASQAKQLMNLSDNDFCHRLADAFQNKLGAISNVSQRVSFPLIERVVDPYVKHRAMLIGDALHTIHPLAGLGVNLGLGDVASFTDAVLKYNMNFASWQTLRYFERGRKGAIITTTKLMKLIQQSFSPYGIPAPLRGFGMNLITNTPLLKQQIINFASG